MYDKITLKQARADLEYLKDHYGMVNDFCGTFCNTSKLYDLLQGKTTIKKVIVQNIEYYFENGIDNGACHNTISDIKPDIADQQVQKIIKRYGIQYE